MLGFPGAAQPEVMRAAEKDEHYVASLSDACHEAFRHALGMSFLQECHMGCSNECCRWDSIIDFRRVRYYCSLIANRFSEFPVKGVPCCRCGILN